MANRYWVGNGGAWNDPTNHWATSSGGSPGVGNAPTSTDDVFFDANSFSSGGQTVTIGANSTVLGRTIDWSAVTNNPTWTRGHTCTFYGSMILGTMSMGSNAVDVTFAGTSSYTMDCNGLNWNNPLVIDGVGGTLTLLDDLFITTSRNLTITRGHFDANDFNVDCATVSSNNSNTRVVTMGSGTWTLAANSGTIWNFATATGLTINAETSTIKATGSALAGTFAGGGKTYNNLWFSAGSSIGTITITGSNTFADFKDDGSAAHSIKFTAGTTTTVTTFTVSGTAGNLITIGSVTAANHRLNKVGGGTIDCDYLFISRSTATPESTWYAGDHSSDGDNNSGWIFPPVSNSFIPSSSITQAISPSLNVFSSIPASTIISDISPTNETLLLVPDTDVISEITPQTNSFNY